MTTWLKYDIVGDMRKVIANSRTRPIQEILVDDDIYREIGDRKMWVFYSKKDKPAGVKYSRYVGDRNGGLVSHYVTKPARGMVVDHINRNVLDNRRQNLRVCTQAENSRNKTIQSNNKSGIPSVIWQKDANMWRVRLKHLGKKIHIGYFKDKKEAGYVRDQVIMQLHGGFARTYTL